MASTTRTRKQYDWKACAIALVAGFAVAVPAALAVTRLIGSAMFLVVIVTLVGTGVSRWTYAHVARPDSRPIDDETCSS
jgi:FtsH-binding integral membrane protein